MSDLNERIANNVNEVRQRIADAAKRSQRSPAEVTLVAVTKYVGLDEIRSVIRAGVVDLGENRPQQLWEKAAALAENDQIRWHQIGHLQRNKVAKTIPLISLLHSTDSQRLLSAVNDAVVGAPLDVLLEINLSGEEGKHGWQSEQVAAVISESSQLRNIHVRGLMGMGSLGGDATAARREFANLREIRDSLQTEFGDSVRLDHLSMGMSGDFEIAIEEGATLVRVGSALWK